MEELLGMIIRGIFMFLFILLIPVTFLAATPFILIWPGRRLVDGTWVRRNIRGRYRRIWKVLEGLGPGIP